MPVFTVLRLAGDNDLDGRVRVVYGSDSIKIAPNIWIVNDQGVTTKEVCDKLDASTGGMGQVVVTKMEGYFGFAPTHIWEWLSAKGASK